MLSPRTPCLGEARTAESRDVGYQQNPREGRVERPGSLGALARPATQLEQTIERTSGALRRYLLGTFGVTWLLWLPVTLASFELPPFTTT